MKRNDSRRGRALRALAALSCLVLAMHFLNIYNFTPSAALRDEERKLGVEKTQIISRAEYTHSLNIVLSGADDRLLISELRGDILVGWQVDNSWQFRRDPEQPIQLEGSASGNESVTYLWLCGWVEDPSVTELKLRARCRQWYGVDGEELDMDLTVTDFQDWKGERVFLLTSNVIPATYAPREVCLVTEQGEQLLWRQR